MCACDQLCNPKQNMSHTSAHTVSLMQSYQTTAVSTQYLGAHKAGNGSV